jgi:esterase/lipase superfamily enzyme
MAMALAACSLQGPMLGSSAPLPPVPVAAPAPPPPPPPPPAPMPQVPAPPPVSAPAPQADYAVVKAFFATDRQLTGQPAPDQLFGGGRGALSYGSCEVSIPRDHRMGELEAPSIWRLEFRQDPAQHVVLLSAAVQAKDTFFTDLAARVRRAPDQSAFVFVHGYNVSFADAARRTAQMSYDLGFEGAPVFYSWPSQGATAAYTVDEQNVEWAQANLQAFLQDFFDRSEAQHVYLIAHSMGNRALTRALAALLAAKPAVRERLTEVILAAPDMDAEVFKRDIVPALTRAGRPVTLYASSGDKALAASRKVHGYARAGDSGHGLVVLPGLDTIDASGVDTSLLGHSYFADTRTVLSDMHALIRSGLRPAQRPGLVGVASGDGPYWEFRP